MRKTIKVLKGGPKLPIRMTRDSVCAGDDVDAPHEKTVSVHSFVDPTALVSHLASGYLPSVKGVGHTWDCILNEKCIATVSVSGISPKVTEVRYAEVNHLHFAYNSATY
jgi:hypothetical protein